MEEQKKQSAFDLLKHKKISELTKEEVVDILCEAYHIPADKYTDVIRHVMADSQNAARYTAIVNYIVAQQQPKQEWTKKPADKKEA